MVALLVRRHRDGIARLALFLLVACGREDAGEPARFSVVGELEAPPAGAFWAPIDIVSSDDGVWVLDAGAAEIYGYDREGGYVVTMGRKGSGPGELREPLALGITGDSLWVLNSGNRRIEYYSLSGVPLGSEPFSDSLPPPVDLARLAGHWFMSTPFHPGPLLRFGGTDGDYMAFGSEIESRARELSDGEGEIPDAYRMEIVDGRLWAFHLYLPIVGVYDSQGRLLQLLSYPAPDVEAEEPVEEEIAEGRIKRLVRAPRVPAGAFGLLDVRGDRFLLTHQRSGDRQRIYRIEGFELADRATLTPSQTFFFASAVKDGGTYVIGTRGEDEEPAVFIVD